MDFSTTVLRLKVNAEMSGFLTDLHMCVELMQGVPGAPAPVREETPSSFQFFFRLVGGARSRHGDRW